MADDDFDRQYAGQPAKLHYTNQAISAWGCEQTGLPIDFRSSAAAPPTLAIRRPLPNLMGLPDFGDYDLLATHSTGRCGGNDERRPGTTPRRRHHDRPHPEGRVDLDADRAIIFTADGKGPVLPHLCRPSRARYLRCAPSYRSPQAPVVTRTPLTIVASILAPTAERTGFVTDGTWRRVSTRALH